MAREERNTSNEVTTMEDISIAVVCGKSSRPCSSVCSSHSLWIQMRNGNRERKERKKKLKKVEYSREIDERRC